ncbi:hypothetical protein C7401_11463 [Paraburkholderia unamae]|uniref:hypothetical protein n=1 Tax=Paraburkholderia unamae TaxID=219649 RepID=UPI000DC2C3D2|nr:hypothetical protein [Paraburkholderia unamae]RAR57844.1 hypothetical protein C7401_11463 [Paraburkholderia unamae]
MQGTAADRSIRAAKCVLAVAMMVMAFHFWQAIANEGVGHGAGMDVFLAGYRASAWQAVINADLIVGLLIAVSWIYWRERGAASALSWIGVILWWGNIAVAAYAYRQLNRSSGNWRAFFLGARAKTASTHGGAPHERQGTYCVLLYLAALLVIGFIVFKCWSVRFALVPTIGYVWGLGCFVPPLLLGARSRG